MGKYAAGELKPPSTGMCISFLEIFMSRNILEYFLN